LKRVFSTLLALLVVSSAVFGADLSFISKEISLQKDEQKKILVKYEGREKLFKFRWTLYINDGLVIHRSYGKIVGQNILYAHSKNQSFKQELVTRGAVYYDVPYMLVKFKEFDAKKNEAKFQIFLFDRNNEIKWKFLKNK